MTATVNGKGLSRFGLAAALGLLVGLGAAGSAEAQKKPAKKAASSGPAATPPLTKRPIRMYPKSLAWGMSHKQVALAYDKVIDGEFEARYRRVSPGVQMQALDAEVLEAKNVFRRSRIDFGKTPTGLDGTPLRGEYTYLNKESLLNYGRQDKQRYFFFIQDKLWKIVDEHKLGAKSPFGKTFEEAVVNIAKGLGPGRVIPPDPDKGRYVTEVDWKDQTTHLRAVERGDTSFALIFEDNATASNIAALRTNKPKDESTVDPVVAAATRKNEPAPPPPEEPKGKAKPKK